MSFDQQDVQKIAAKSTAFSIFSVKEYTLRHKQPSHTWSPPLNRVCVERPAAVVVIPYDPWLDRVVLVEQFRVGPWSVDESPWLTELVAGMIEANDTPENTARKELKEETRLDAIDLTAIQSYWVSPGASNERVYLFSAIVDSRELATFAGNPSENEYIILQTLAGNQLAEVLDSHQVSNSATLIGLSWLRQQRQTLQAKYRQ